jgi:hypothetical protein
MPIFKKLSSPWLIALQCLLIVLSFLPLCLMEKTVAAEPGSILQEAPASVLPAAPEAGMPLPLP